MPTFKVRGRILVYYAAFADHYSVYPASTAIMEVLGDELKPYVTGRREPSASTRTSPSPSHS